MNKNKIIFPQVFGIIGESLGHSLSPIIHNHFIRRAGLTATYTTFPIDKNDLVAAIEGLRVLGISGVNVTNPYKEQVIPLLDGLARSAQRVGAVNTIKNVRGRLIGHNTDLSGISATLSNRIRHTLRDRHVVLLGSGGVARSCLIELIGQHIGSIAIFARSSRKAQKMVAAICKRPARIRIEIEPWSNLGRCTTGPRPVIVLNATSTPPPQMGEILKILAKSNNRRFLTFLDVNYGRRAVPINHRPESLKYIDGLYMLAVQAVESFRIWTGLTLEAKTVYRYARRKLQETDRCYAS